MQALRLQTSSATILLISAVFGILSCTQASAAIPRSSSAKAAFKRSKPCPSTQQPTGPCAGWIIDHIVPLCAGGPDRPDNMQWQTVDDAKLKDRDERRQCARPR